MLNTLTLTLSSGACKNTQTCVSTEGVQTLPSLTVGGVDVTVPGSGADQDGSSTLRTLHEGQVSDCAIMHAELKVRALDIRTTQRKTMTSQHKMTKRSLPFHPWWKHTLTSSIAGFCTERKDFDIFIIGACSQQLPTVAPRHTVDGTFVVLVPLEPDNRLLDWT